MLLAGWVRLHGGFWKYRTRIVAMSGGRQRAHAFVYRRYLEYLGSYISLLASIDGPPKFPHKPTGVFIAPQAKLGRNVTIYQQVTIGRNETVGSRGFGSPSIGDDVYIGAGAKIIGNVRVGAGAKIGAGAIVVSDVPAGATAVSPAAIIRSAPSATRP